jgi:hypothetical protein
VLSVASGGSVRSGDITYLLLGGNQLTSFDGTGLSSLTSLQLYNNQLTSFDGTGLSSLTVLSLNYNQLTGFSSTGLSALTSLTLSGNPLTSFDPTGLTAIQQMAVSYNPQLSSMVTTGFVGLTQLRNVGNSSFACDFASCALPAEVIDAIFTALPAATNGAATLRMPLNPGSATATASIATSKGYTVQL